MTGKYESHIQIVDDRNNVITQLTVRQNFEGEEGALEYLKGSIVEICNGTASYVKILEVKKDDIK